MVDRSGAAGWMKAFNRFYALILRLTKGRLSYRGAPSLILHTVGRRSGQPRQSPLLYLDLGDGRVAVIASNGGDDHTPAWVHNLRAAPDVEAEVGGTRRAYRAAVATPEERAEMWPQAVAMYKSYASYQLKTTREIPMVVLTPAPSA